MASKAYKKIFVILAKRENFQKWANKGQQWPKNEQKWAKMGKNGILIATEIF